MGLEIQRSINSLLGIAAVGAKMLSKNETNGQVDTTVESTKKTKNTPKKRSVKRMQTEKAVQDSNDDMAIEQERIKESQKAIRAQLMENAPISYGSKGEKVVYDI